MSRGARVLLGAAAALVCAAIACVLSTLPTANLGINAAAGVAIFFLTFRGLAGVTWRTAALVTVGLVFVVSTPTLLPERRFPEPPSLSEALARTTIPLPADLRPHLDDRRIVALGEATRGTSEFFRWKHRLLEYCVTELGFRDYAMELSPTDGQRLDNYINGSEMSLKHVLYWPWATQEAVDMLRWMRDYNASAPPERRIRMHGIDPGSGDRDGVMAANIRRIVDASPETKLVVWAHNAHISAIRTRLKPHYGEAFYAISFDFDHGAFTSRAQSIHTFSIAPSTPDYYSHALARLPQPELFLDFASMQRNPVAREWLNQPRSSHELQEFHVVYRLIPRWHTLGTPWPQLYDALIFVRESTPAENLGR